MKNTKKARDAINRSLIKKIAVNSRLELTEKEIKEFLPQLKEVIKAFSTLDKIKTPSTPTIQPIDMENVFREDIPAPSVPQASALKNTKHKKDGFFISPKTF